MPPDDALVTCTDAALTFGRDAQAVVAVHGANLTIRAGDRLAVVGSSGSGKSSLLHLIAGLEQATTGSVTRATDVERSDIGLVFQNDSLIPALNVAENAALPLILAGHPEKEAQQAALTALDQVGVRHLADRLPEEISGGQAQRVAVARVLTQAPRLILADEPTGRLDHASGGRVLDALLAAADLTRAALVVTTHDPSVAARLARRRTMRDGRLLAPEETP
ncbi:ATP-binding cassette domain-containing protein [Streptomyces adustus]|uniref:ATP-binding cassette domain-containing protein n=2 Tax=Streptomyces adustus TaxID=1609272 RepID=A0A5N8V9A7_9ACTN|nr:ATP-binding cassette domain-containing protein [Streptomyces adustus]MPY30545.1 ATP-binding cassette domain-containing protein [Streptomyces adustus]